MESNSIHEEIDGLIQRIHVQNFQCHDNLVIDFSNKNITWITGRNGSGKSTILIALVVGLGGKAAVTKRSSNIQSFIKKGADYSVIEIKIKNNTQKAYKPEIYGDHITVIRKITTAGTSAYKVKSASGAVISTKYAEISNIILAHDIQIDNPISVLNQDDARTLCSTDATKLYSLFKRATNFDHCENNYMNVTEICKNALATKKEQEKTCADLLKNYNNWENKHRQLLSRNKMKTQIRALENEIAWSEIAELELKRNTLNEKIVKQTTDWKKISEKLADVEHESASDRNVVETSKLRLEENNATRTTLEREKRTLEEQLRDVQTKHRSAQQAAAKKRDQLAKEKKKIAHFETEIRKFDSGADEARSASLQRRADAARARADEAGAALAAAELRARRAGDARDAARAARRHAGDGRDLRERVERLRHSLQQLRAADPLAVWGPHMNQLRRRLQAAVREGQFSAPPLGPVGFYLRLKDQRWGSALEHIIGGRKTTFCVNNQSDRRRLFEIMQEVYGNKTKPSVTCSRYLPQRHDVSQRCVRAKPSALDMLDVQHNVVANFLIDNLSLETVLLVADHDEAMRLADTEQNVPVNCSKIVTEDCTEYYPAPNYRSYGRNSRQDDHRYLHLSTEDANRSLCEELALAEADLQAHEERAQEASRLEELAEREAREAAAALRAQRNVLLQARQDCERYEADARRARDRQRGALHDELEEELDLTRQTVGTLSGQLEDASAVENTYAQTIVGIEVKLMELKRKLDDATDLSRYLNEEIAKAQSKVDNGVAKQQNDKRKLEEIENVIAQLRVNLAQQEAIITEKTKKALSTGARADNPRDRRTLKERLQDMSIKVKVVDDLNLDMEKVEAEMASAKEKYDVLNETLMKMDQLIAKAKNAIQQRLEVTYNLKKHTTRRLQYSFLNSLSQHGYYGSMEVDHVSERLTLQLSARDASRRGDARSLSGGERSYGTMALLLALWSCVELPFYFLDEFDVYLDDRNRQIVVDMLLSFARRHPARQFVLLAPAPPHARALAQLGDALQTFQLEAPRP